MNSLPIDLLLNVPYQEIFFSFVSSRISRLNVFSKRKTRELKVINTLEAFFYLSLSHSEYTAFLLSKHKKIKIMGQLRMFQNCILKVESRGLVNNDEICKNAKFLRLISMEVENQNYLPVCATSSIELVKDK